MRTEDTVQDTYQHGDRCLRIQDFQAANMDINGLIFDCCSLFTLRIFVMSLSLSKFQDINATLSLKEKERWLAFSVNYRWIIGLISYLSQPATDG